LYGQKHVPSSNASIIMSLETPIACIFAVLILQEDMNIYSAIGLVLMFLSVLLVEVNFKKKVDLSKYKFLLFDVDDTLLDFQKAEFEAFKMLLNEYNIEYCDKYYEIYRNENHRLWKDYELGLIKRNEIFENRLKPLFTYLELDSDPVKASYDFLTYLSKGAYLIGNTYQKLEELSKKYKLYIITNGEPKVQYPRLKEVDIMKFFDGIFVSEEIGASKPNKEFFEYIEKHIPEFKKEEAIVIGDSLTSDMLGAYKYGIDTCWFNPNNKSTDLKLKYIISSIDDIR
jgi:2-haloacid dehalogenase